MGKSVKKPVSALGKKIYAMIHAANFNYIKDFEKASGVRPDSVRRLCGGYTQSLPYADLEKVAKCLHTTVQELYAAGDGESIYTGNLVPGAAEPCWYEVRSDEMAPTFKSGDKVLVDAGVKQVKEAGVYLIGTTDSYAFRRMAPDILTGLAKVYVDNRSYAYAEEVPVDNLKIIGRVIGIFQRI